MNISDHLSIGWHLLRREAYAAVRSFKTDLIDVIVMSLSAMFAFGYFMPGMGMPKHLSLPAYLGAVVVMALFFGFIRGGNMSIDISSAQTMHYYTSLPVSLWVSLGVPVIGSVLRTMLFTLPSGAFGIWWLQHNSQLALCWWKVGLMAVVGHLFLTFIFMIALFSLTTEQYYGDLWPRVLGPMFSFGCLFFTWRRIADAAPGVARLLLLNPMVHFIEGVRSGVLDPGSSLPLGITAPTLIGVCIALGTWYAYAARRRLALVVQRRCS